ncbi:MAG: pentapeptide repeat-containing protein [Pseudomonadota bacterium]
MTYVDPVMESGPTEIPLGPTTQSRPATVSDIPVNPYSLLEAVNASSAAARGGWVLFLAIASFILIAVAGVTHRDLLLNAKVDLPILQVEIELTRFFLFAPILLLFVHFGMLIQHVMLARKTLEFDRAIRAMEPSRKATHPLRLELNSYFFTQALAGPQRGWLLAGFLHLMIWISLVVLPVMIMLFTQVVFLPYHDTFITWVHRIVLVADMAVLAAVGVFLRRTEASFVTALFRSMRRHPANFFFTGALFTIVLILSFFVATIPGEYLDRLRPKPPVTLDSKGNPAQASLSFVASVGEYLASGRDTMKTALEQMFSRNLIVTDLDIVKGDISGDDEVTIVLRDRDLQNAKLDRTDLRGADLAGADFRGASLNGTILSHTDLSCSPRRCTRLESADLSDAVLRQANLEGASLRNARAIAADMRAVQFSNADLTAADFSGADLRRARLTNEVNLYGAELPGANLRGAYLGGVNLHGANLSNAKLQGAYMAWVNAFAADLSNAELDGAYMNGAQLQGANLDNASMLGTDLSSATIWASQPPSPFVFRLARVDGVNFTALSGSDVAALREVRDSLPETGISNLLARQRISRMIDGGTVDGWQETVDGQAWGALVESGARAQGSDASAAASGTAADNYQRQITGFLGLLACQRRWADGSVADGVITRAMTSNFGGDTAQIYRRVTGAACPASANLSGDLVRQLSGVVEARSNALVGSLPPASATQGTVTPSGTVEPTE